MEPLADKRILLGVSGGIAAYKSAELVRRLREAGAEVQVVLTAAAAELVRPLTFTALSGREALYDGAPGLAMAHIDLARWAQAVLVAPCSANTLGKLALGLADNLLTTLCLAGDAPLLLAPAMNRLMWEHPAVQENVARLRARGVRLIGPAAGPQACGETGAGRMSEPAELLDALTACFTPPHLAGKRVLITAGPTREALDPVRFLSNRSSGKMGFALAAAARDAGAAVTLIAGPVALPTPPGVERIDVESAAEMHAAALARAPESDIFIGCAAVADYRPAEPLAHKLKRRAACLRLELVANPDIVAEVAALPAGQRPFVVGFAAETDDLTANALDKLRRKGLDLIAANRVGPECGFERDDNALELHWPGGSVALPRASKTALARALVEWIAKRYAARPAREGPGDDDESPHPAQSARPAPGA